MNLYVITIYATHTMCDVADEPFTYAIAAASQEEAERTAEAKHRAENDNVTEVKIDHDNCFQVTCAPDETGRLYRIELIDNMLVQTAVRSAIKHYKNPVKVIEVHERHPHDWVSDCEPLNGLALDELKRTINNLTAADLGEAKPTLVQCPHCETGWTEDGKCDTCWGTALVTEGEVEL